MLLRDVKHDRAAFEYREIALLIGRYLAERVKRQMGGFLHRCKRHQADIIRLTDLLQCPAHASIPCQSLAAIRRSFERGDDGGHLATLPICSAITR